jgi:outer membrane protein assembly factor BamD (BamD/ComL family)
VDRIQQAGAGWPTRGLLSACLLLALLPGCASFPAMKLPWSDSTASDKDAAKKDSGVVQVSAADQAKGFWHPHQKDLEDGRRLIEDKKLEEAEKAFHAISNDKKCPEQFREEALFYEGEAQRLQKHYRGSEETFALLFKDFPSSQFTERADRALFEIALFWLEATRAQMDAYEEQRQGKRWFVAPIQFIHFSSDMPTFDPEGHAVRVLEGISLREKVMHTAVGEQALLYLATIRFYREDYLEADRYYTDLYQHYPNSKSAAKAIKQSIVCKTLCTGGTCYDLRTVEESRKLIHTAQTAYPEFGKDTDWIQKQLTAINLQQADRDWRIAEFYRWTSHPGPAYFYYELVRRCYPNTEYATKAAQRIAELERRHPEAVRENQVPSAQLGGPTAASPGGPPAGATPSSDAPRALPPSLAPPR